jgi:hypothetical protein
MVDVYGAAVFRSNINRQGILAGLVGSKASSYSMAVTCYIMESVAGNNPLRNTIYQDIDDMITCIRGYGKVFSDSAATFTSPDGDIVPPVPTLALIV